MITIYNTINQDDETSLLINKQLLYEYKDNGDDYLVETKRQLTRSLVDYKVFQQLQQINNSFFVIIDYLDCDHYTRVKDVVDDKNKLVTNINLFLKPCKSYLSADIYDKIYEALQGLVNTMNKLVAVVQTINKNK
jgi:hypothetical protein